MTENYFDFYKRALNASNTSRQYAYWTAEEDELLLKSADLYNRRDWGKISSLSRGNVNVVYGRFKQLMKKEFKVPKNRSEQLAVKNDIRIAYNYLFFSTNLGILSKLTKLHASIITERLEVILPKLVLYKEFFEKKQTRHMIDKSFLQQNQESKAIPELTLKMKLYAVNLFEMLKTIQCLFYSATSYSI